MTRQDLGVPQAPRIRLARLLVLLRVLAGPRGRSSVAWSAGGFRYELFVTRDPTPLALELDVDGDALHGDELAHRVVEALRVQH